jgi:hypothetical protein
LLGAVLGLTSWLPAQDVKHGNLSETDPVAATAAEEEPVIQLRQPSPDVPGQWSEAWHPGSPEVDFGQGVLGRVWPGSIRKLDDLGIHTFGWWMISLQGNPVGGIRHETAYAGLFDFGFDLDMEKIAGVTGMSMHFSGSWASGSDLSDDVGSFVPVNAVFSGDSLRFFEGYVEQKWAEDMWSVRAGRVSIGWEYGLDYDLFTQYLSAAFRLNVFGLDANAENFPSSRSPTGASACATRPMRAGGSRPRP